MVGALGRLDCELEADSTPESFEGRSNMSPSRDDAISEYGKVWLEAKKDAHQEDIRRVYAALYGIKVLLRSSRSRFSALSGAQIGRASSICTPTTADARSCRIGTHKLTHNSRRAEVHGWLDVA